MTGDQLYELTTELNGNNPMNEDVFYSLLNMAKGRREMSRDWCVLRTFDSSITFSSSDDYTSTKALPSRFLRVYQFIDQYGSDVGGVYLITSSGSRVKLDPIPFAKRYDYKDVEGYYYIDHKNSTIGRTGATAGTLHLYFLQGTEDIDGDSSWSFPSYAHPLLAVDVVILQKGIIDWDTVNQSQIPISEKLVSELESSLNVWDARLQQAELGV